MLLDPIIYTYIAYILNVSSVYLGICGGLWSLFYILASIALGSLGDKGNSRLLIAISLVYTILSRICFINFNMITVLIAYIFHAISIVAMNLAINTIILDTVDNIYWNRVIHLTKIISHSTRGALMILLPVLGLIDIFMVQQITIIMILISLMVIPSTIVISERSIYRMYGLLRDLGSYLKASTSILYIDNTDVAQSIFERVWQSYNYINIKRIYLVIILMTFISDYVFTVLPLIVKDNISLGSVWLAYGIASLSSLITMLIFGRIENNNKYMILILMLARSIILITGISYIKNVTILIIYITITSMLYLIIDSLLYNLFITKSSGYRSSIYYSLREVGSIIGAVVGGIVLSIGLNIYVLIAISVTILLMILII